MRKSIAVPLFIVINIGVYVAWYLTISGEVPKSLMTKNFLVSYYSLIEGRYWTLLTAAFSHNMLLHIFVNMFVLHSFGRIIEVTLGFGRFVIFYLIAAIFSSLSHALVSAYLLEQPQLQALGASGAVAGVMLLFAMLFPKERILIMGIIPVPAIIGAFLFIGLDLWGLFAQKGGGGLPIGHGAHLGGALIGILYYIFARPRYLRR